MRIRDKANGWSWCARSLERLARELDRFVERGCRIPEEPGGWWHQYVCPEHHTELLFDPFEPDAQAFRCPHGCVLSGEPYRGGWLVFKHQSLARYALQAAAVYAGTGERRYAELAGGILKRYAEQFPLYPIHPEAQAWMLKGRAFHQALSEAIWATTLIRAYMLLRDEGAGLEPAAEADWTRFLGMLETSMGQYRQLLIYDRGTPESNYTAWLNAALAAVYAAQGERDRLLALIDGEGGFAHHLTIGVKPDQFEYEGSTYYHVFVLRAYLIAAEMAARFGVDLHAVRGREGQSLQGMLELLADLANERGELPALHDGPYRREPYAREIAEVLELGLAQLGIRETGRYGALLEETYRQLDPDAGVRSGLEAVAFGVGAWDAPGNAGNEGDEDREPPSKLQRGSRLWADSGFAVLRHPNNPLSALIDFGPHGGSHGHYDKLHVTLDHRNGAVAPELGMVPYGSALRKMWYAATASHNTVTVGGHSQAAHTGACLAFRETAASTYVWARSDDAYEGWRLDRHLLLTSGWLLDWLQVERLANGEESGAQQVDWWLHHLGGRAEPVRGSDWEPCARQAAGDGEGYAYVQTESVLRPGVEHYELLLPVNGTPERGVVHVTGLVPPNAGAAVYCFTAPGTADDPSVRAGGVLHRQTGKAAAFVHVYADVSAPPIRVSFTGTGEAELEQDGRRVRVKLSGQDGLVADGLD